MGGSKLILALICTFLMLSCQRTVQYQGTKILGHRGVSAGNLSGLEENSLASILKAIEIAGACEVDLRLTADGYFVVYHDGLLKKDSLWVIEQPLKTLQELGVLSLQDLVLELDYGTNYRLSLDMKWSSEHPNKFYSKEQIYTSTKLLRDILFSSKKGSFILESNNMHFNKAFKADGIKTQLFYIEFADYNRAFINATEDNMHGISCRFDADGISKVAIQDARNSGISSMLWTPNSASQIQQVLNLEPDYIQTDSLNLALAIQAAKNIPAPAE